MFDYKDFEISRIASNNITRDVLPIIGATGDLKEVTGKDATINYIRNLLMTPLGYYPFDPNYGSLLYKQLFEMNDEISESEIKYEVKDRVEENIPGVHVDTVTLQRKNKEVLVDIYYTILKEQDKTKLSITMKQMGQSIFTDDELLTNSIWGIQ